MGRPLTGPAQRGLAALTRVGPHAGAHRVAARAALSVLVPLLLLVATGHANWTVYAAFGAFASLYGRLHGYAERAGMQLVVGALLVACVTGGVAAALLPGARWVAVAGASVIAAVGALLSDAWRWHPPGPLFLVFAFSVCAALPARGADLPVAVAVAAASAALAVVIGTLGGVRRGLRRPVVARPAVRAVLDAPGGRAHLARYVVATALAGTLSNLLGIGHPYWAMVGAVVPMAAADTVGRVVRGVQRLGGTLLGLGLAAALLPLHPRGAVAVLLVAALQCGAELFVGRNYALALVFVTPLALLMGQLAHELPVGPLVRDRAVDTAIGVAVAILVTVVSRDRPSRVEPARPARVRVPR